MFIFEITDVFNNKRVAVLVNKLNCEIRERKKKRFCVNCVLKKSQFVRTRRGKERERGGVTINNVK